MLHQLWRDMTQHTRNIVGDVRYDQENSRSAGNEFKLAQFMRATKASVALSPSVFVTSPLVSWYMASDPGALLVFAGAATTFLCIISFCIIHMFTLRLDTQDARFKQQLKLLDTGFTAVVILSAVGWSLIVCGMLTSPDPDVRALALVLAVGNVSIGALGSLSLPTTNMIWLSLSGIGLFLSISVSGADVTEILYPLVLVFLFALWRSNILIWNHYAQSIMQARELADAREQTFAVEQEKLRTKAEVDLRAQKMLADQHDRHVSQWREGMAGLAGAFETSVLQTVDSFSLALQELASCADALRIIGEQTGDGASQVTARAANVGRSVQNVAGAAAQLSQAAQSIAGKIDDQHEAATLARASSKEGSEAMVALAEQAANASQIATLIEEIASQTNLLALNATIEAARAGEAGRGFAVVANEVKQLAGQTRGAIHSVGQTVNGIRTRMSLAEMTIDSIAGQIDLVSEGAAQIAKVIADQGDATSGIDAHARQVASDARSMEDTARSVSSNAQQVKSMAEAMRGIAARLDDQAGVLRQASAAFLAELKAA